MTPKRRQEIEDLARDSHQKHKRYMALSQSNTPTEPKEAEQAAVNHALAMAEYYEAKDKLKAAIRDSGNFGD